MGSPGNGIRGCGHPTEAFPWKDEVPGAVARLEQEQNLQRTKGLQKLSGTLTIKEKYYDLYDSILNQSQSLPTIDIIARWH